MPALRDIVASLDRHTVTNAAVAWLLAITGPLAILLAVASKAGFTHDQVAAWIFGGYAIGGFLSILMSWMYRQPIGVAWSIPGAILIAPALDHLGFAEIVGASTATGLLIAVLGITGWVRKVMSLCPLPVVMGMVCGVFLPFGLKIITGFEDDPWIALAIVVAFIATSAMPALESAAARSGRLGGRDRRGDHHGPWRPDGTSAFWSGASEYSIARVFVTCAAWR